MGKYTVYSGKVDQCIQAQLDIIVDKVVVNVSGVHSIILSGGFGRGEGSVLLKDGKVIPLKDYDIHIFVDEIPERNVVEATYDAIYKKLDMKNPENANFRFSEFVVDLQFKKIGDLKLLPDIANYDLKKASNVLYGNDLRSLIPWNIEDIPLSSGLRFLFEKMTGLIGHFSTDYLTKEPAEHEKNLIIYECYKTYIEIATVLCLLMGCYEPSYKLRSQLFKENFKVKLPDLYKKLPELPKLVEKATKFKLRPNFKKIDEKTVQLWDQTRKILFIVLKYYLEQYLEIEVIEIRDFSDKNLKKTMGSVYHKAFVESLAQSKLGLKNGLLISILNRIAQVYLNYIFICKIKENCSKLYIYPLFSSQSPIINIYLTSPSVLFSLGTDGKIEKDYFSLAKKNLKKLIPVPEKLSWNDLKDAYILAYKLYNQ